jgi:hypothetical protein
MEDTETRIHIWTDEANRWYFMMFLFKPNQVQDIVSGDLVHPDSIIQIW